MSIRPYIRGSEMTYTQGAKTVFIQDLENAYQTYSIYRAIVVTDIDKEIEYKEALEEYSHTVLLVQQIENMDYDNINARVLVMNYETYYKFLDCQHSQHSQHSQLSQLSQPNTFRMYTSYNLIAMAYDFDEDIKNNLIEKYQSLAGYHSDETIII